MRRSLFAVVAAVTAVTTAWSAWSAGSALAQPTAPSRSFGVKAAYFGETDLNGGHFAYALERGTSVRDAAEVINYTDAPLRLDVYAADVRTAEGGGALAPAQRGVEMRHVGKWLTLDDPAQSSLELAPKGRVTVPFTLTIPSDVATGDFPGALVVSRPAAASPGVVGIEPRVAMLVDLSVPGETKLAAHVTAPTASEDDGSYRFRTEVANAGNVLFTVEGHIEVRDGDRIVARVPLSRKGIYVIPGGRTTLEAVWDGAPFVGRRSAVARVRTFVDDEYRKTFASEPTSFTIVPWTLIGSSAAGLSAAAGLLFLNRRRIGRWRQRRREDREIIRRHRSLGAVQS